MGEIRECGTGKSGVPANPSAELGRYSMPHTHTAEEGSAGNDSSVSVVNSCSCCFSSVPSAYLTITPASA